MSTDNPVRDYKKYFIKQQGHEQIALHLEESITNEELQLGLMYRTALAPRHGMIFIFDKPQKVIFWMKNTYLSLDIIMLDESGQVIEIYPNQKPFSTEKISSHGFVKYVVELQAGESDSLGISEGDKLILN